MYSIRILTIFKVGNFFWVVIMFLSPFITFKTIFYTRIHKYVRIQTPFIYYPTIFHSEHSYYIYLVN